MPNINQDIVVLYDLTAEYVQSRCIRHATIFQIFWSWMFPKFHTQQEKSIFYIIFLMYQYKTLSETDTYDEGRAHFYNPEYQEFSLHTDRSESHELDDDRIEAPTLDDDRIEAPTLDDERRLFQLLVDREEIQYQNDHREIEVAEYYDHDELAECLMKLINYSLSSNPNRTLDMVRCADLMYIFLYRYRMYINANPLFRGMIQVYNVDDIFTFDGCMRLVHSHPEQLWDPFL